MKYETFVKKLDKFIDDNLSLVEEYDDSAQISLHKLGKSLHEKVEFVMKKSRGMKFDTVMNAMLASAVTDSISILDVDDDVMNVKVDAVDRSRTAMQIYFDDIRRIYDRNDNNFDIEFSPENRDKLIEMNLKSVVAIAKKYQGAGVPIEDLICAGNLGLCIAFDKFKPEKSMLRSSILKVLDDVSGDLSYDEICDIIRPAMSYGSTRKKFYENFEKGSNLGVEEVRAWVESNVKNARFNSVAVMWIRAYILIELDNNSRTVKKNKTDIKAEKDVGRDVYVRIDEPAWDSGNMKVVDAMYIPDDHVSEIDSSEAQSVFRSCMSMLLDGVKIRNRRILLQKFGIGYPRPITPKEIADQEGLSIARVSQIVQTTIDKMRENQKKFNIDPDIMYQAIKNIY